MKTNKRIWAGLCALAIMALLGLFLLGHKALALTSAQLDSATYTDKFVGGDLITGVINGSNVNFKDSNIISGPHNYKPQSGPFCDGTPYGNNSSSDQNKGITLTDVAFNDSKNGVNTFTASINFDYQDGGACKNYLSTISFVKQSDGSYVGKVTQAGDQCDPNQSTPSGFNCVCVDRACVLEAVTTSPSSGSSDGNACEAGNNTGLEWLICGILRGVDDFVSKINAFIDGQLNFNVQKNLIEPKGIKQAWDVFRVVASALLVIIMLLMVFSQAISAGPFDAYTVRKLLPRLVAAVILIQVSWYFSIWVIEVANDLGRGIAALMAAPFGGTDQLDLDKLIGQLGATAPSLFVVGSLSATAAALLINPFGALMLAFIMFIGVITALAVLLIRQALIIACVILLPIALVAWILPGTQKYWKLLWDNFVKALLLFPIIVGVIYVGRIFAWIIGTGGGTPGILDLFAIVIGFFGPYFLLPKAFKWGGTIMSSAGGAINGAIQPMSKSGKEGIKGMQERYQGAAGKKYDPNSSTGRRALRRIQSGHFIPSVPGLRGAAERSRRLTIASGNKWAAERTEEAEALVSRTYEKALTEGYRRLKTDQYGNYLDANDNITDKEHAEVEELKGVEAGKQALVDITGWEGSDAANRAAQNAHKKLLDTHSEIELQKARIQGGRNEGKRFTEVGSFRDTLENSPPHYGATSASRPDQTPDVQESAFGLVGYDYDQAYAADNTAATRDASGLTEMQRRVREIDKARLNIALDRLTPDSVQSAHYGLYQDIARVGDPELASKLASKLALFQARGGVGGANAVGSLRGGKEKHVNAALALAGASLDHLPQPPEAVVPPVVPTVPPPMVTPEEGIDIHHDDETP